MNVFGDASLDAFFSAVAYLVTETRKPEREFLFIMGKAGVAPVKRHTIPKLELTAAVTGKRFRNAIIKEHSLQIRKIFMWSDFTTVIQWIRSDNVKNQHL